MNNLHSNGEGMGDSSSKAAPPACCQPSDGKEVSCCNRQETYWGKGKTLLAALIIMAAIGVAAVSFMKGNTAPGVAAGPYSCCPAPSGAASCTNPARQETSPQAAAVNPGFCPPQSQCGAASIARKGAQ